MPRKKPSKKTNESVGPTPTEPRTQVSGKAISDCLQTILDRCKKAGVRLDFPGEGGERPFRGWLVSDLIIDLFGWPREKVVVGERFDILLQDSDGFPVVTIETKTPYHKATKKERDDFEARLSGYGTLRTAFFTNGIEWERLDIFAPAGVLNIRDRFELNLQKATNEELEAFFAPLFAGRHFGGVPRSTRHSVSRDNPHILKALAADLDQTVGDLAFYFRSLFAGLRKGQAGENSKGITVALFNLWCEKSLIVPHRKAAEELVGRFKKNDLSPKEVTKALSDLGFTGAEATNAAEELLALPKSKRQDPDAIAETIWPAYEQAVDKLCAQTAHVILARALLYRAGEDQNVFPRLLSGPSMEQALATRVQAVPETPLPASDLLGRVRLSMADFLPTVYKLGEFDWWLVPPEKRAVLGAKERGWLRDRDTEFERTTQRLLRMLNGYSFGEVDVDVWRNVYQHYLPAEERQKIGGFYTPDELVNLILDLSEYTAHSEELCQLSFIDPACGSGAFVTGALGRLLEHLEESLPCHASLHQRSLPDWKRAEQILRTVGKCVHAVDLHPFAAFLTTLNVLFLILPLYVKVREKNQDFSIELHVFSADSLEKHDTDLQAPDLFTRLNSRIQLTEDSFHRYQEMLKERFDRVFGNPPWGGVLKGPLAPVYDTVKKERFAREFPNAAQGKYDVYGLFVERALQVLKPGGRFGLITQGSFIDKEWARGLRKLLATKASPRYIVDLNPFGQLFFHAMNIPCITVADSLPDGGGDCKCKAIISKPPADFKELGEEERRKRVVSTIREVIKMVDDNAGSAVLGFASAATVPIERLRETAHDRWNLAAVEVGRVTEENWVSAADLLEHFQGVTVGGENCLGIFLISREEAGRLDVENELTHPVIKARETTRWSVPGVDHVMIYPYVVGEEHSQTAFAIEVSDVRDERTTEALRKVGVKDSLDFDRQIDEREKETIRRQGVNRNTVGDLLKHRIAMGLVRYPGLASYLAKHYEQLEGRVFEKRNIRECGKRWYEYHRPRDPRVMLAKQKIIAPRLAKEVRFALDVEGILPQDSCICLVPDKTRPAWTTLRKQLSEVLGREVGDEDALMYCLAFLNSKYAQERLTTGHRPRPGEVYALTEAVLREILIPPPPGREMTGAILESVGKLLTAPSAKQIARLETALASIVDPIEKGAREATGTEERR